MQERPAPKKKKKKNRGSTLTASRVAKYNLGEEQRRAYEQFTQLLAKFPKGAMVDIASDALKDAQERKLLAQYGGIGSPL